MNVTKYTILFIISLLLFSCEKVVDIEIPENQEKLVVEGSIEPGVPPVVLLTETVGYYFPTDSNTYKNSFVKGAIITVSDGITTVQLDEFSINGYTVYTTTNPAIFGQIGSTYNLVVNAKSQTLTATTTIPNPISMDGYWYKDQPGFSNYGYLWFNLNDPPELGNAYRIFTQRKGKDVRFIPADGSVWDDQLINGLDFDAFIFRGHEPNSVAADDNNETSEYFKQGDTIIIKFCTIDLPHFDFWETFETAAFNNGNPFASPTTIRTNIQGGGIGVWGGYGVTYDTLVAVDL
jgi:hypothetical protein